jgi:hypothetical protein
VGHVFDPVSSKRQFLAVFYLVLTVPEAQNDDNEISGRKPSHLKNSIKSPGYRKETK